MTQLTKELGGHRYLVQIGRIVLLFNVSGAEADRVYKQGLRVKHRRWDNKLIAYRARKK